MRAINDDEAAQKTMQGIQRMMDELNELAQLAANEADDEDEDEDAFDVSATKNGFTFDPPRDSSVEDCAVDLIRSTDIS